MANIKPYNFKQYDGRWGSEQYATSGENTTISESGCGPTCAADIITTLTGKMVTPSQTCKWAVNNGFKAFRQGTYYSYFTPQFAEYGIRCEMMNWKDSYQNPGHQNHETARYEVRKGNYVIALMKPGLWTRSGHFVVVYDWDDAGNVSICDPASDRHEREHTTAAQFTNNAAYYWVVDAVDYREHQQSQNRMPNTPESLSAVIQNEIRKASSEEMCRTIDDIPEWYLPSVVDLIDRGIIKGVNANGNLNLTKRECRMITIMQRMFADFFEGEESDCDISDETKE